AGSDDHYALLLGRDVECAGDAGFPLEADLPELAAEVADMRLFDVRQADGFDQLRNPDRISGGSSANSPSTVSFNVSTVHAIARAYQIWYCQSELCVHHRPSGLESRA